MPPEGWLLALSLEIKLPTGEGEWGAEEVDLSRPSGPIPEPGGDTDLRAAITDDAVETNEVLEVKFELM